LQRRHGFPYSTRSRYNGSKENFTKQEQALLVAESRGEEGGEARCEEGRSQGVSEARRREKVGGEEEEVSSATSADSIG